MLRQTENYNDLLPPSNPDYPWNRWEVLCYYCSQPISLTEPHAYYRQRASYHWIHTSSTMVHCDPAHLRPDHEIDDPRCHICGTQTDQHAGICSAAGKPQPRATPMNSKEDELIKAFGWK